MPVRRLASQLLIVSHTILSQKNNVDNRLFISVKELATYLTMKELNMICTTYSSVTEPPGVIAFKMHEVHPLCAYCPHSVVYNWVQYDPTLRN